MPTPTKRTTRASAAVPADGSLVTRIVGKTLIAENTSVGQIAIPVALKVKQMRAFIEEDLTKESAFFRLVDTLGDTALAEQIGELELEEFASIITVWFEAVGSRFQGVSLGE